MLIKFNFVLVLYYSNDMQNRTICSDIMVHIHENHSLENYVSFLGKEQPQVNLWTKFFNSKFNHCFFQRSHMEHHQMHAI